MHLLTFSILISSVFGMPLGSYREDGFVNNVLTKSYPSDLSISVHSSQLLTDGTIAFGGTLSLPIGISTPTSIRIGPGLPEVENITNIRLSALVFRVSSEGHIIFSMQTAFISPETSISITSDNSDNIFVAGTTTGIYFQNNDSISEPGPFLCRVNRNGTQATIALHPEVGDEYVSITWRYSEPNVVLLGSFADSNHDVFLGEEHAAESNGIIVARVDVETLQVLFKKLISVSEEADSSKLMKDKYWHMCQSSDEKLLYFAVKRHKVEGWTHHFIPSILAISATDFSVSKVRELPKDLQLDMKIGSNQNKVFTSYVARINNRETITVRKLNDDLEDDSWGNNSNPVYSRVFTPDDTYFRQVPGSVTDIAIDSNLTVHVLLHAAELINRSNSLAEEHRKLSNGRPALLELSSRKDVIGMYQSTTSEIWEPRNLLLESQWMYITGTDKGILDVSNPSLVTNSKPLLTARARNTINDDPDPSNSPQAKPDDKTDENACIGATLSTISGKTIDKMISENAHLRVQIHPLLGKASPVDMLCLEWKNDTYTNNICATPLHVLKWHDNFVFMRDLCNETNQCTVKRDTPINFKGACGNHLIAHEFLSITMHSGDGGSLSAQEKADSECRLRRKHYFAWLFTNI